MLTQSALFRAARTSSPWLYSLLYVLAFASLAWSAPPQEPETLLFREGGKPSLSGDGIWVAYQCNNRRTLCLSNAETGQTEELVTLPAGDLLQDVDISRDGMVIAYWTRPGVNGSEVLYVYDRATSSIEAISVDVEGELAIGMTGFGSYHSEPHLNGDGRFAIFSSLANDLIDESAELADTNSREDVFVRDRLLGVTRRISLSYLGQEGDASSGAWGDPPTISSDGNTAVFLSGAENLTSSDILDDNEEFPLQWEDIFLVDIPSGSIIRISEEPDGFIGGDNPSTNPGISPNGQVAAFVTKARNLHTGPYSGTDLLIYHRAGGTLTHVNKPLDGVPIQDNVIRTCTPEFNFDGSMLYFCSGVDNLAIGDGPRLEPDPRDPSGFIERPSLDVLAYRNGVVSLVRPVFEGQDLYARWPSVNDLGDIVAFEAGVVQADGSTVQMVGILKRGDITPPLLSNFTLIPNGPVVTGVLLELEAIASDINRGDTDIKSAQFRINDGEWLPFPARDGEFDNELEILSAFYDTSALALGTHTACARAEDAAGLFSRESCVDFEVVVSDENAEFMVLCSHSPLWPQAGETVRITTGVIVPPGIDDSGAWFPVERTEIWFNDKISPAAVNDYFGTSSNSFQTEALSAGSFSYGCRAKLGDKAIFSGWRTVSVGDPGEDQAIPVIFTGPSSDRIDIVFVADGDTYQGSTDPDFLKHIEDAILKGFYRFPLYNRFQHLFNFWISTNTGLADREPGESCTVEKPSDWEENYAFADAGAIIHQDDFRDCAREGMFTFQPGEFRTLRHEAGHRPFGLSDEYCCDTSYFEARLFPNMYKTEEACEVDAPNLGREPQLCRDVTSTRNDETFYTSEPQGDDLMQNNTIPRAADVRRILWLFDQCASGLC